VTSLHASQSCTFFTGAQHLPASLSLSCNQLATQVGTARRALSIAGCHAVGGGLHLSDSTNAVTLRVFLDGSLLECFTSTGQVMTARVYRDPVPVARETPISAGHEPEVLAMQLAAYGSPSEVSAVRVRVLGSAWEAATALAALEVEAARRSEEFELAGTNSPKATKEFQVPKSQGWAAHRSELDTEELAIAASC
jgi:hypothetical protein